MASHRIFEFVAIVVAHNSEPGPCENTYNLMFCVRSGNSHPNFPPQSMAYSKVTVNLFEMKLNKLAQIIQSVEIAERSKYLKAKAAKAAKAAAAPNPHRIVKRKPQTLRFKKKAAVDKLEYGKWR